MNKVILGAVLFPLGGPVLSSSLQDQLANFLGVVGLVPKADITERELNINKFFSVAPSQAYWMFIIPRSVRQMVASTCQVDWISSGVSTAAGLPDATT